MHALVAKHFAVPDGLDEAAARAIRARVREHVPQTVQAKSFYPQVVISYAPTEQIAQLLVERRMPSSRSFLLPKMRELFKDEPTPHMA